MEKGKGRGRGKSGPLIGCHVSIAGGVSAAPARAAECGCTAYQIFTRNPRGWKYSDLPAEEAARFRAENERLGLYPVAHMPYLPNLAAPDPGNYKRSVEALIGELRRCDLLGIEYLVTHLGSHLGTGEAEGRRRIVSAIRTALEEAGGGTMILMENTAGTKNSMGTSPEELADFLDALDGHERVGLCIDTAHAFAAGYDWTAAKDRFLAPLKQREVLDRVRVLHLNDSKVPLGKCADRHHHLGLGEIGLEGLQRVLKKRPFRNLPIILETPVDEERDDAGNVALAWKLHRGR
ncbi:MAG: deoxyribonuclease IV [Candidatus Hydrogenedentota bacterium]|nr:MAG: deoxyribonuclease IV [Candidatus Hydrogenedentota bacterium]